MIRVSYIAMLKKRLGKYFEIEEQLVYSGKKYDLIARHQGTYGRTLISKVDIIDCYYDEETHYVTFFDTNEMIENHIEQVQHTLLERVLPANHRQSTFVIGIVVNRCDPQVAKQIMQYKMRKNHCMGLKGWTVIQLVYVGLDTKEVYTSASDEALKRVYTPLI